MSDLLRGMSSSSAARATANVKRYSLTDLKDEKLSPKLSRAMIVGRNEMLGYFRLKKGCKVPAHRHPSEQISIMLEGAMRFEIGSKRIVVNKGQVLVIPPNVEHSAFALKKVVAIDCYSPLREDWLSGKDDYLKAR